MDFFKYSKMFIALFVLIIALDGLWIGFLAQSIYQTQIGHLLKRSGNGISFNIPAGLLVWFFLVLGNLVFVLPLTKNLSFPLQFAWGALFGLVIYGVYDLTNFATLRDWPLMVTLIDLTWGMFLNGIIAVASGYLFAHL